MNYTHLLQKLFTVLFAMILSIIVTGCVVFANVDDGVLAATTSDPILLHRGTVLETSIDLSFDIPIGIWEHTRTYQSGLRLQQNVNDKRDIHGQQWLGGTSSRALTKIGENIRLTRTASNSRVFMFDNGEYAPPAGLDASLVKLGDNYYRTTYIRDRLGREVATARFIDNDKWQVDGNKFDWRGRTIETFQGVTTNVPDFSDIKKSERFATTFKYDIVGRNISTTHDNTTVETSYNSLGRDYERRTLSGTTTWKNAAKPIRPEVAPTASDENCLVTKYAYSQMFSDVESYPFTLHNWYCIQIL